MDIYDYLDRVIKSGVWRDVVKPRLSRNSICVLCRGRNNLCGKPKCPVIMEFEAVSKYIRSLYTREIYGNTPPSIFVGRYGYPKVYLGPLVPPIHGDTRIYDYPEYWIDYSLDKIIEMRSILVFGGKRVDVSIAREGDRYYQDILDISLSILSPEVELKLARTPVKFIEIDEGIIPFGPRGPLENLRLGTLKIDYRVERASSDYDLRAEDAVWNLYLKGIPISRIQRVFSVGGLGLRRSRRIVPTRWSITAVDDIICRRLIKMVKKYPLINDIEVYEYNALGNKFIAVLIPRHWSYEFIEAWYPGTFWNRLGDGIVIESDYELYGGREDYAEIGGCYYASRLATLEYLNSIGRQATVVIFREIYPSYVFPVGVWIVRESVRRMFRGKPIKFNNLVNALRYVYSRLKTPREDIGSFLLDFIFRQRRMSEYV